jgi:hyperosmotically inducible protein
MNYRKRVIIAILCALPLTSCHLALLGGAAGGGYYVGTSERSIGVIFDDATITGRVKSKLIGDSQVDAIDINVDTSEGVVTLIGHVPSQRVANRAVALAGSAKGVVSVRSKLVVIPD